MPESESDMPHTVEDKVWGFQITGGVEFDMPLTVFQVTEGGRAFRAGIKLGDTITKINGVDTDTMSLQEAQQIIAESGKNIKLAVSNEDEEVRAAEEEDDIILNDLPSFNVPRKMCGMDFDLAPPPKLKLEFAQKKCWHPVMLESNPVRIIETTGEEEPPHKLIIRNMRQAMGLDKPKENYKDLRSAACKTVPNMFLYLCQSSISMLANAPEVQEVVPVKQGPRVPMTI